MMIRVCIAMHAAIATLLFVIAANDASRACCPAGPMGRPVVNADQSVIIIWDSKTKTQHFIRRATFKSEADDFGFLIPTPNEPELEESGNGAFPFLERLTAPEVKTVSRPKNNSGGCSCGAPGAVGNAVDSRALPAPSVNVLAKKEVAGFDAVVLEAESAKDLVDWLSENEYAFSPEVEAWAKPYVEEGWKITALKVAKPKEGAQEKVVAASALRMSFKTERPLFPYREPDSTASAKNLDAQRRLLRIYFFGDARYNGELTKEVPWTGQVAWANPIDTKDWNKTLELLKLPEISGTEKWWLTEFEDNWPYRVAPADLYFSADSSQRTMKRPPIIRYVSTPPSPDVAMYATAAFLFLMPPIVRHYRRRRENRKY